MRVIVVIWALLCLPHLAEADVLVSDYFRSARCLGETIRYEPQLVRVSELDDAAEVSVTWATRDVIMHDLVLAPDGWLYGTFSGSISRFALDGSSIELDWVTFDAGWDIAVESSGALLVLDRPYPTPFDPVGVSGIYRLDPLTKAMTLVDTIPGFDIVGMDVPRSGPFEDGMLVLAADPSMGSQYYLWRYRRESDGSLSREGPFGPLDLLPHFPRHPAECGDRMFPGATYHLVARRSGLSFLAPELCRGIVQEFDLDGNLVRTFATVTPDPTVLCPLPSDPTRVWDDTVWQVHCTAEDHVYVAGFRRMYHHDADGNLIRQVPWLFDALAAVAEAEFVPFATAGSACSPRNIGYWKRQCLGEDQGRPMFQARRRAGAPGGGRLPPGPPVHPSRQGRRPVDALLAAVDARLGSLGVTACAALWPDDPSLPRARALGRYAAVLLNIEDRRLGRGCRVLVDGAETTAGAVANEIGSLLLDDGDAAVDRAARLAAMLLHENPED